jgi:hypothetical protein
MISNAPRSYCNEVAGYFSACNNFFLLSSSDFIKSIHFSFIHILFFHGDNERYGKCIAFGCTGNLPVQTKCRAFFYYILYLSAVENGIFGNSIVLELLILFIFSSVTGNC